MMVGHSNPLVNLIANKCEVDFVSIENDKIAELIKQNRAFHKAILHKAYIQGLPKNKLQ